MLVRNPLFQPENLVESAIEMLRIAEPEEGYYVAFSGGKDSCLVLDLVKRAGVKYDAHYNWTSVDPPELLRFVREKYPEVTIHQPEKTMWQLIEENGPPTRLFRFCCKYLKENGGEGRRVVTGVRRKESASNNRRAKRQLVELCYLDPNRTFLNIVIDWTNAEVWEYLTTYNVPTCPLYLEGWDRLGCIGCPNGPQKRQFKRWPKHRAAYRRAVIRFYNKRPHLHETWRVNYGWESGAHVFLLWENGKMKDLQTEQQRLIFG